MTKKNMLHSYNGIQLSSEKVKLQDEHYTKYQKPHRKATVLCNSVCINCPEQAKSWQHSREKAQGVCQKPGERERGVTMTGKGEVW
jgi:hypothetical protein